MSSCQAVARSRTTSGWRVRVRAPSPPPPPPPPPQVAPTFRAKKIMSWLTAEQRQRAGELSCRLHALTDEERRFCFGVGLIDAISHAQTACEPCGGAAQLI